MASTLTGYAGPPPRIAAQRRRPLPRPAPQLRRLPPLLASNSGDAGPPDGQQQALQDLLREAERLREEQRRMEREAGRLAAALQGLPATQQRAVLEALGLQRQQEGTEVQQAAQQQAAAGAGQQTADEDTEPDGSSGEEAEDGDAGWMEALPPQLQQQIRDSGLAGVLRQQAAVVAADRERDLSPEFGGGDMEELARMIEEGRELPPLPDSEWEHPPEEADAFKARMTGSIEYAHADLKGSKHPREGRWPLRHAVAAAQRAAAARGGGGGAAGAAGAGGQAGVARPAEGSGDPEASGEGELWQGLEVSEGEAAALQRAVDEAEAAAAAVTTDTYAVYRAVELFAGAPKLAAAYARGWEQAKQWDKMWMAGETEAVEATERVPRSVPAPPLPPDVRRVFKAAERLAYVLRRAHKDSRDPAAPLLALQAKGLASQEFVLQDPFIQCPSLERSIKYLQRLTAAGATLQCDTVMLRCGRYTPKMDWRVHVDCYLDFPYPPWLFDWVVMNAGAAASSAPAEQERGAGAEARAGDTGAYAAVAPAAVDAALAAAREKQQAQDAADAELAAAMLESAAAAAAAAGTPLDSGGALAVLQAAAGVALRREAEEEEAARRAAEAAAAAAREADAAEADAAVGRRGAPWRDPPLAELAPIELAEAHEEGYLFEGQRRRHRWVLLDSEKRDRQRGRQEFDVYPRHPPADVAPADKAQQTQQGEQEQEEGERARQYALLQPPALLEPGWSCDGLPQLLALYPAAAEQLRQQLSDDSDGAAEPPPLSKDERRRARRAAKQRRQQEEAAQRRRRMRASGGPAAGGAGGRGGHQTGAEAEEQDEEEGKEEEEEEEEEEYFPFTFDWERQRRRREAGQELRQLFGPNFKKAMATLPRMGRTKGPNSNSALRKELDAEGTAWLGGECMTVQLTFSYCMDPDTCLADSCSLIWGAVHGLHLREVTDAFDIYLACTGLLLEEERRQDAEERQQLEQGGLPPLHQLLARAAAAAGDAEAADLVAAAAAEEAAGGEGPVGLVPVWRQYQQVLQEWQQYEDSLQDGELD